MSLFQTKGACTKDSMMIRAARDQQSFFISFLHCPLARLSPPSLNLSSVQKHGNHVAAHSIARSQANLSAALCRLSLVKVMLDPGEGPVLPEKDPDMRQALLASLQSYQAERDSRPTFREGQAPARYRQQSAQRDTVPRNESAPTTHLTKLWHKETLKETQNS